MRQEMPIFEGEGTSAISEKESGRHYDMSLPAHWAGDTIQVYLAVKGKEGKKVSDSVYLGEHTAV